MDDSRVLDKLDEMDKRIDSIDITLAKQHLSLEEHIKRSNMLEAKLEPVEKHVQSVNAVLKFAGGVALLLAAFESIKNLMS